MERCNGHFRISRMFPLTRSSTHILAYFEFAHGLLLSRNLASLAGVANISSYVCILTDADNKAYNGL